jgi:hypothetical protein
VRARAAQVEAGYRRAVRGHAGHWPAGKELVQTHGLLEDVASRQPEEPLDVWRRDVGLAIGHVELVPKLVALPLRRAGRGAAEFALRVRHRQVLAPGASFDTLHSFVAVHHKGMKEPWFLVFDAGVATASEGIALYGKRFSIEETFRDQQDPRFGMGLDQLRITDPVRRDRMLLLAAMAQVTLTLLVAPISAVAVSLFILGLPFGRRVGWTSQQRQAHGLPLSDAVRCLWPQTLLGLVLAAGTLYAPAVSIWFALPVIAGLLLSVPLAMLSASPRLGRQMARSGLCRTPEEAWPQFAVGSGPAVGTPHSAVGLPVSLFAGQADPSIGTRP